MAADDDRILLRVGLDTSEADAGVQQLGQRINQVSQQDLGTTNVKSYKLQIRELTAELQRIEQVQGRNSAAFRAGAKELGRLKEAARDFKTQIEAYDPSNKLAGLANIAKGGAVALTGLAGSMALFGVKGEKATEVMEKLMGIMALSHALNSIHEITNGYRSFINMLGLGVGSAKGLATATQAQTVASVETTAALAAQTTAQEALAAAQLAYDEAATDAEAALTAAKAEGLDATVGLTGAEQAYLESAAARTTALAELTAAQTAFNTAVEESTALGVASAEGNIAQAATQGELAVAEEATTVATVSLKIALWSIGIGLIITAIAYLVSNWKELKKSITDLFPALSETKGVFKEFQNDIMGVGSAIIHILKAPIDAAITAIKILVDILKGDFKAASKEFDDGIKQQMDDWNVVANFKSGVAKGEAKDAIAANKVRVQAEIDANERIIKERKALGKETYALEIKNQQLKNSLLDEDADDYKKKLADGESEIRVLQNAEIKKRADEAEKLRKAAADKAAALKKQDLDKLKSGEDEAAKVILEGRRSQRDIELADADFKSQKLIDIAKKYGQDASSLEEALGITKSRINKKYTDEISAYLQKADDDTLNEFDKKRKEILKAAEDAMKNATPEEAEQINASRDYQINRTYKQQELSDKANAADVNATNVATANREGADGKDNTQTVFNKAEAIRKAKLLALQANYAKEQGLAANDNAKKLQLAADFEKNSKELEDEGTKARIALAQAEKEAKLATYDEVSQGLTAAADIAGKNTVAGKALAVASATISTYLSAQKAYESQFLPVPDLTSPVRGAIAAGVAVASGLANIKTILAVKVPGASSAVGQTPSYSAPTINSTILNQAQQGTQNVNVLNQPDSSKREPMRAYVVERDITDKQDRAAYLNRQSTI